MGDRRSLAELEQEQEAEMQRLLSAMNQGDAGVTAAMAAQLQAAQAVAAATAGGPTMGEINAGSYGPIQTPCAWLDVLGPSSLTALGLPAQAPCCTYVKGDQTFSDSNHIVSELVCGGEVTSLSKVVTIHHDADWTNFPEVGRAIKASGTEPDCFAIATCESLGKWGVGIAPGWKGREMAARVALAVAISTKNPPAPTMPVPLGGGWALPAMPSPAAPIPPGGLRLPIAGLPGMPEDAASQQFQAGFQAAMSMAQTMNAGQAQGSGGNPWDNWEPAKKKKKTGGTYNNWGANIPAKKMPIVHWVSLAEGASLGNLGCGFPRDAPAVTYSPELGALSHAQAILTDIVGNVATEVLVFHSMDEFPQVAAAVEKAAGGVYQAGVAIAVCRTASRWAVGIDAIAFNRELAAKLALAVALAPLTDQLPTLISTYPDFATCVQEALEPGSTQLAQKETSTLSMPAAMQQYMEPVEPKVPIPRDTAIRIKFATDQPLPPTLEKMLPDGLAVCTDGKKRPKLYGRIDEVLKLLLIDPETEVEYHDDPDANVFPALTAAVRQGTDEQFSFNLAVCPSYGAWGLGLNSPHLKDFSVKAQWWIRNTSAKVALASVLYLQACEVGAPPDVSDIPSFENFVYELMPPQMQAALTAMQQASRTQAGSMPSLLNMA